MKLKKKSNLGPRKISEALFARMNKDRDRAGKIPTSTQIPAGSSGREIQRFEFSLKKWIEFDRKFTLTRSFQDNYFVKIPWHIICIKGSGH